MFYKIKCPKIMCKSTNIEPITQKASKKVYMKDNDYMILSPLGIIVPISDGFDGKKSSNFICQNCGKKFNIILRKSDV